MLCILPSYSHLITQHRSDCGITEGSQGASPWLQANARISCGVNALPPRGGLEVEAGMKRGTNPATNGQRFLEPYL
jgi:hypothetical protein